MKENIFDLSGKNALIVGGTGGLGEGFALELAKAGASVALAGRKLEKVAGTVGKIIDEGGKAWSFFVDLSDESTIESLFDSCEKEMGTAVDIVINTAGMNIREPVLDITREHFEQVIGINLTGVVMTCRIAAARMIKAGKSGRIINMASISSILAHPDRGSYAASKAGLVHITRTMGVEWAKHGITVNCISPTAINTGFVASADAEQKARVQKEIDKIPMGRIGEVEDVTGIAVFLASDSAGFITGQNIIIDGGRALD